MSCEDFDSQFKGTVGGAVNAVKAVLPHMEKNSYGKIVNIGTVSFDFVTCFERADAHTTVDLSVAIILSISHDFLLRN